MHRGQILGVSVHAQHKLHKKWQIQQKMVQY